MEGSDYDGIDQLDIDGGAIHQDVYFYCVIFKMKPGQKEIKPV